MTNICTYSFELTCDVENILGDLHHVDFQIDSVGTVFRTLLSWPSALIKTARISTLVAGSVVLPHRIDQL